VLEVINLRLLFFTDTHIRGTSPKNRKDDFVETLEEKLYEISWIIDHHNIDFVLHGGDLFDRPDVSVSIVSRFAKILNKISVPIYMISGNHDIYGHNPKTINRTMMGLLKELDILNIINKDEKVLLKKDGIQVQLTGQPYVYNIDESVNKNYYIVNNVVDSADYSIHLVHGMLLDRPFIKGVSYTLIDDIKTTLADITLAGHYHSGFNEVEIDGKYFLNPGSIVRISNSLQELKRKPKVIIIDLNEEINISYIHLKTAKEGKLILDRREIENNIYKRERLYEFKHTIDATLDFEKMNINDVLIKVSNTEGIEEAVKEEALRRIANIQMNQLEDK